MNSLSCCTFNSKCQDFLLWRCECYVQHLLTVFNEFCLTWPNFHHLCYCVTGVLSLHTYGVKKHFSWSWGKIRTSLILACCLDFPVYLGLINLSGIHWALGWPFVLKNALSILFGQQGTVFSSLYLNALWPSFIPSFPSFNSYSLPKDFAEFISFPTSFPLRMH